MIEKVARQQWIEGWYWRVVLEGVVDLGLSLKVMFAYKEKAMLH